MKNKLYKKLSFMILGIMLIIPSKVNAGLGDGLIKFCDNFEKVQSYARLLSSYTWFSLQWLPTPSGPVPVPGTVLELAQDTSPIVDFCNYIRQLQNLETADQIFLTGEVINTLTNNRWGHHQDFAEQTWSLAQNAYDFDNGEFRKGAIESEALHQEMNSYMNDSYYWFNKTYNGEEKTLKDRAQRENDMRQLANTAYERATLEEALDCPEADTSVNYGQVYDTQIRPKDEKAREFKDEVDFFYSRLLQMGSYFMNDERDHAKYIFQVESLKNTHMSIDATTKKTKDLSTKASDKQKNSDGSPKMIDKDIDISYNEFKVKVNSQAYQQFKNEYNEKWQSYVTNRVIQKGFDDLLDDPEAHIEEEFINLNYECAEYKLMRGIPYNRGDYSQLLLQRKQQCERSVVIDQNKAEGLINYYTDKLKTSLLSYNSALADSMSLQSKLMKRTFVVTSQSNKDSGVRTQKVTCVEGKKLKSSTIIKLNSKIKANNAKIRANTAKDRKKMVVQEENERKEKIEVAREMAKRQQFAEKRAKRLNDAQEGSPVTSPLGQTSKQNY